MTLAFLGIAVFTLTIGQKLPVEFSDWRHMHLFYDIILHGLPIATLATLVWTIKKDRAKKTNLAIIILTPLLAMGVFCGTVFFLMFSYGFGAWVDEEIIYEHKNHTGITIKQQVWDEGALGYGAHRIVELTPFLGLWNIVEEVDTAAIEKKEWTLVEKEGSLKFP